MRRECRVCGQGMLQSVREEEGLVMLRCSHCRGTLIEAGAYRDWLQSLRRKGIDLPPRSELEGSCEAQAKDSDKALRCGVCSGLMQKYEVGEGLAFRFDQCGACNSFWFDEGEWQSLRLAGLHDELPRLLSPYRQQQLRQQRAGDRQRELQKQKLGEDFERVDQFRSWLQQHPQRDYILSLLRSGGG